LAARIGSPAIGAAGRAKRRPRVQFGEELIGGGLPLALTAPHHAPAEVIADQRQVAMTLAPRDLVDRDLKQIAETI